MTATATAPIAGYVAGTWDIDAAHSSVSFSVRHMMVSKVRAASMASPAGWSPALTCSTRR